MSVTQGQEGGEGGIQYIGVLSGQEKDLTLSGQSCFGISLPDYPRHEPIYSLLHWLPSIQLVEAGSLTSGRPYARPTTLYQRDHIMFISPRKGAGSFWYSQVEAIDSSLCTEVYC